MVYAFYIEGKKITSNSIVECRKKAIVVARQYSRYHKRITIFDTSKIKSWNGGEVGVVDATVSRRMMWEPYDKDPRWLNGDGTLGGLVWGD